MANTSSTVQASTALTFGRMQALLEEICGRQALQRYQPSLLFVGPKKSGKTTLLQRLQHFSGELLSAQGIETHKNIIIRNIFEVSGELLAYLGRPELQTDFELSLEQRLRTAILKAQYTSHHAGPRLTPELVDSIHSSYRYISAFPTLRALAGPKTNLDASTKYLLDNIHRIGDLEYVPVLQDILFSWRTDHSDDLVKHHLTLGLNRISVQKVCVDSAPQEDVGEAIRSTAPGVIVVCIPINLYDDEEEMDRLFTLWIDVIDQADNTPVVLVFNKIDLFGYKLGKVPLNTIYPSFTLLNEENILLESAYFIAGLFRDQIQREENIEVCFTTATGRLFDDSFAQLIKDFFV